MCRVLGPASRVQLLSGQVSEDEPERDWVEPSLFPYNSKVLQANGSDRVYYAIHLLQTDPSVQVQFMVHDSYFNKNVYVKFKLLNFSS